MALPPMRPRTIANGMPKECSASASFEFGGADETDRHADDRRGLRPAIARSCRADETARSAHCRSPPASPPRRSPHNSIAAAERVLPISCRELGRARVAQGADDIVVGRQPRARHAVRDHLGVAEDRRAGVERGAGGIDETRREDEMPGSLDLAAGMDHADGDLGLARGKPRQVGLGADDREGALVDRRAVLDVVGAEHRHACLNVCATSGPSRREAGGRVFARLLFGAEQHRDPSNRGRGVVLCDICDRLVALRLRGRDRLPSARPSSVTPSWPDLAQRLLQPETWRSKPRPCRSRRAGDLRCDGAGSDVARRAGRRAGAGDDGAARVGGIDDEAGLARGVAECVG